VRGWGGTDAWVAGIRSLVSDSSLPNEDAEYLSNALCTFAPLPAQLAAGATTAAKRDVVDPALAAWARCAAALGEADRPDAGSPAMDDDERAPTREVA
jgi:hypothetical protein